MLFLFNGCSQKTVQKTDIYTLKFQQNENTKPTIMISNKTLEIMLPQSTKEIRKNKILYAKNFFQRESYAYSRWSDTPNKMLAQFLISKLDQSGIFNAVLAAHSPVDADLLLQSTIEDFYQYFEDNQAYAIVKIRFFLIDKKDKNILSKHYFSAKIPSDSLDAKGGVKAFHIAIEQITDDVKTWLISAL